MSSEPAEKKTKLEVKIGTVNSFQSKRGFGFISQEDGPDVFVHQSQIKAADDGYRVLRVGQQVEYTAVCENNRWKAVSCTGLNGAALPTEAGTSTEAKAAKANRGKKRGRNEPARVLEGSALVAAVKKQIGYYLSDTNLKRDLWMRQLLLASNCVSVTNLLKCNKLRALTQDLGVIQTAMGEAKDMHMCTVAIEGKEGETEPAVARGPDADNIPALPSYTPPSVLLLTEMATDVQVTWKDIRAGYLSAYSAPVFTYLSHETPFIIVNSNHKASVARALEGGIKNVDGKQICSVQEVSDSEQKEALLKAHYDALARQANRSRKKRGRSDRKAAEGPCKVGNEEFASSQDVYDKVRGIMKSNKNNEPIMGEDKKFVMNLFKAHPRATEKLKFVRKVIIKENHQHDGNSRCFFLVNKDGAEEDISYVKCIRNL
jgi:cold shock CspA family protein